MDYFANMHVISSNTYLRVKKYQNFCDIDPVPHTKYYLLENTTWQYLNQYWCYHWPWYFLLFSMPDISDVGPPAKGPGLPERIPDAKPPPVKVRIEHG